MTINVQRSDYTSQETFVRLKLPAMANALRFLADVTTLPVIDPRLEPKLAQFKVVQDRNRRCAVTLIFQTPPEGIPLDCDEVRVSTLQWLANKWALPCK